jgi:hypothetical protein
MSKSLKPIADKQHLDLADDNLSVHPGDISQGIADRVTGKPDDRDHGRVRLGDFSPVF